MAMRFRCEDCRKTISIDEAFAGGACRCPYCKAIGVVPAGKGRGSSRSRRPGVADRPDVPAAPAPAQGPPPVIAPHHNVPTASPVLFQGIVAIVMSVLLVVMLAGAGIGLWALTRPRDGGGGYVPPPPNPFAGEGARVAGMAFTPPVAFVMDAAASMYGFYDPATAAVRYSVRAMSPTRKFNLILACEEGARALSPSWVEGGPKGDEGIMPFVMAHPSRGSSDLDKAVLAALDLAPKTVAVLSAKAVADPAALAAAAKAKGVRVLAVSLGARPEVTGPLKQLAEATGGEAAEFTEADLVEWLRELPALP